jgi:hypothetical protein
MQIIKIGALLAVATILAGCEGQTQTERALTGALAGGLLADATDNNVATTAAIGALAGIASCGVAGAPACSN